MGIRVSLLAAKGYATTKEGAGGLGESGGLWNVNEGHHTLVAFVVKGRPVSHATVQHSHVNIVEVVGWIDPFAAAIVYFKPKVGRWIVFLDRRQVGALRYTNQRICLTKQR